MEELKRIINEEKVLLKHVESLLEGFKDMKEDFRDLIILIKTFIEKQEYFMSKLLEEQKNR
jgi:hypothetical protein